MPQKYLKKNIKIIGVLYLKLYKAFCPGPITFILKKNPNFDIAFYFDCSLKKSAYRRYIDLKKKIPLKKVLQNLSNRRVKDRTRKHSALKKHKKAVLIRSDLLNKQKMIHKMSKEVDKVIKKIKN